MRIRSVAFPAAQQKRHAILVELTTKTLSV